ncbi:unnamed protein product, partial [Ectocarpus sp. 12 AP-2014]
MGEWRKFHLECAGQPAHRRPPSAETKHLLFESQHGQCVFCRGEIRINPTNFDCDHIIPTSVGGTTCLSNLQLLCVTCHRAKSGRERSR